METEETKKKRILEQLRKKMGEISQLKKELGEPEIPLDATPARAQELIEEIEVPPLAALKEEKTKKKPENK